MSISDELAKQAMGEIRVGVLWEFLIWLHKNDPERYEEYMRDKDELGRVIKSLRGEEDE